MEIERITAEEISIGDLISFPTFVGRAYGVVTDLANADKFPGCVEVCLDGDDEPFILRTTDIVVVHNA